MTDVDSSDGDRISAMPTKSFFVDMFTKDIPLDQAVLDLVDNSIDGARTLSGEADSYDGMTVHIELSRKQFRIWDNCGGFDRERARKYAFRFGRAGGSSRHSIGQFGVGMKRALFKFGPHFTVSSATPHEAWAVTVDVPLWEGDDEDWTFPWSDFAPTAPISTERPGTEIIVSELRHSVGLTFDSKYFQQRIAGLIKSKHRSFISKGLQILVNGDPVLPIDLMIVNDAELHPEVRIFQLEDEGEAPVDVRIMTGLGDSSPRQAGWYVICNGRLILDADRRDVTGWGVVEAASTKTTIPGFHNQYARFRGIVTFDSDDSARVPWNTTKTDIDQDSPIWRATFDQMVEAMRPVIDFLNDLDADIDDYTRERSPLLNFVAARSQVRFESISTPLEFDPPQREELSDVVRYTKIQYARNVDDVELLKRALGVSSGKAVGERTFDLSLQKHKP